MAGWPPTTRANRLPSGSTPSASLASCSNIVITAAAISIPRPAGRPTGDPHRPCPADEFKIDPKRIGILGFSAGGHLASTAGTHFDRGDLSAADPIEASCRPDFMVLCYAVIALGEPYTHLGSQQNLLGKNPPPELVRSLSNEKQVTKDTPPTFLFQTDEDSAVPAENSVYFYLALRKAAVPAELHIFRTGRHGLGLAANTPGTSEWPKCCENWLPGQGFLGKK